MQYVRFYILSKLINDSHNVPITTMRAGLQAYDVHRNPLKLCFS